MVDFDNLDELKALRAGGRLTTGSMNCCGAVWPDGLSATGVRPPFPKAVPYILYWHFLPGLSGCIIFMPDIISAAGRRRY